MLPSSVIKTFWVLHEYCINCCTTSSFRSSNSNCLNYTSSHQRCFIEKGVLKNFKKFTGKQLCESFFLNKVPGLRPVTPLKKRLWHRCFSVNFVKYLRNSFFIEHLFIRSYKNHLSRQCFRNNLCRSSHRRCSVKKLFLKTSYSQKTPVFESLLTKLQASSLIEKRL